MAKQPPILKKTCANCGLQKPLTAFLQLSEPHGTGYGNVCADCRKRDTEELHLDTDEGTRRETGGSRIGTHERIAAEEEKKSIQLEIDERYHEGRDEAEEKQSLVSEKGRVLAQDEKKRRESFLDKNRTYVDPANKDKQNTWQEILAEEPAIRETRINLSDAPQDTAIAGKIKYVQSSFFQQFLDWVDKSSPLAQAAQRVRHQQKGNPAQQKSTANALQKIRQNAPVQKPTAPAAKTETPPAKPKSEWQSQSSSKSMFSKIEKPQTSTTKESPADKTTLTDYVKKTWGPGSR